MLQSNDSRIFARDLKHLVKSRYAVTPAKRRRNPAPILLAAGVVTAGVWLAITTFTPSQNSQASAEEAPEQVAMNTSPVHGGFSVSSATPVSYRPRVERKIDSIGKTPNPHPLEFSGAGTTTPKPSLEWKQYTIRRGDTLGKIFRRHDLSSGDAVRIANHPEGKILKKLMPGRRLEFGFESDRLAALTYELNTLETLSVGFIGNNDIDVETVETELDTEVKFAAGSINSSLFRDGAKAGLSDKLITQMVGIFGWDIDFALDLRKGDTFTVAYEQLSKDGDVVGAGDILAVSFVNQGRALDAVRHIGDHGEVEYYDSSGNNLRGTFLRTPLKFSRVTSGFSKRRFHPVLKKWRAHKGVDYGAPRGTKVLSTADGKVSFVGRKKGYGKVIMLRHGGKYSTLYAHLSSFKRGIRPGSKVKQGQVIGFVGKTGMATAPHLHYEFRVHGVHRNPLTYETPKAGEIAGKYKQAFLADARVWVDRLAAHGTTILAQHNSPAGG